MSPANVKRLTKLLRLFEWHVTYTDADGLLLCEKCLRHSLKELNNLTGRRITTDRVYAVASSHHGSCSDGTRFAVQWCIGQYEAAHGR